jgi:hypothetical protein
MSTSKRLTELVVKANTHKGSWKNEELALDILMELWRSYDPDELFIYPSITNWSDLLEKTIANGSYNKLSRDEVLSILFGLGHRGRIVEGLWFNMFEQGVAQKLLERIQKLDTDKHR